MEWDPGLESCSSFRPRTKRVIPDPNTSTLGRHVDTDSDASSVLVPSPATPLLPIVPESNPSYPRALDTITDLSPHFNKSRSYAGYSSKTDKEKRKRSRVTPEQLVHLEQFFSIDRSPTAARRKEISQLLGMQERQTQIWFQNRRAKAKLQDGRHRAGSGGTETPPDTPPDLSAGFEIDLHNLIHEDEPVTVIPCTDLSIGTWRRIATANDKHDLVAYVSDRKRCLSWFIHSAGYGFKMDIPFETIIGTAFEYATPGTGLASFVLSHPPVFYLEAICSDNSVLREWKRCADWTEGQQASKVLQHNVTGSAVQLTHFLRTLQGGVLVPDTSPHLPVDTPNAEALRTDQASHQSQIDRSDISHSCCLEHDLQDPCPILPASSQPALLCSPSVAVDGLTLSSPSTLSYLPSDYQQLNRRSIISSPAHPVFSDCFKSDPQWLVVDDYNVSISQFIRMPSSVQSLRDSPYPDISLPTFHEDRRPGPSAPLRRYGSTPPLLHFPTAFPSKLTSITSGHQDTPVATPPVISGLPGTI